MTHPTKTETMKLKEGRIIAVLGLQTMRSHGYLRYSDNAISINVQLSPSEMRTLADNLRSVADFCDN